MLIPGNIVILSDGGQFAIPMIVRSIQDGMAVCYWIDSKTFTVKSCHLNEELLILLSDKLGGGDHPVVTIQDDEEKSNCKTCGGTRFIKVKSGKIIDRWPCPECKDD